ncbi:hypothetical protein TGARI_371470 [Toxoplasma gondii ARI]|uniref:Uncharacterized protein n=1 Tax=Toxoplasma gondii ARI TaxID=1074872 RepID=A0A139XNB4_TOXGO|nr:hypothetical protein TGARI_371470 [Toxoplasma gondii ARI]
MEVKEARSYELDEGAERRGSHGGKTGRNGDARHTRVEDRADEGRKGAEKDVAPRRLRGKRRENRDGGRARECDRCVERRQKGDILEVRSSAGSNDAAFAACLGCTGIRRQRLRPLGTQRVKEKGDGRLEMRGERLAFFLKGQCQKPVNRLHLKRRKRQRKSAEDVRELFRKARRTGSKERSNWSRNRRGTQSPARRGPPLRAPHCAFVAESGLDGSLVKKHN